MCWYGNTLKNVNNWFKNKAWVNLTKKDIKKVYDDLEDGKIKNNKGDSFVDTKSYYSRIFKSKPFELAGKLSISKEVMEFYRPNGNSEVRFIEEETFRKIVSVAIKPIHKLLIWLAFDIGENINALLKLKKKHFTSSINPDHKEKEYIVNLPEEILKRTRKPRSEITNFKETVEFADIVLKDLNEEDNIFPFGYGQAKKLLDRAVYITKSKCIPKGQKVTWKDLRSYMACYLLKQGWNTDEINKRLGHKPSSSEIDKYVNFLAIDRHRPKKKLQEGILSQVREKLEEAERRERLYKKRFDDLSSDINQTNEIVSKLIKGLVQKGKTSDIMDVVHKERLAKELRKL